jgi:carotenoid cleavage dioxygenase-like enzyme/acyl-CoA reductase-like NAD-dependent aldehyde dehydrogenase
MFEREPATGQQADVEAAQQIHAALTRLAANRTAWLKLPTPEKLRLLGQMHEILRTQIDHEAWAGASLDAMAIPRAIEPALAAEMVMNTSYLVRDLETLIDTLATIQSDGRPPAPNVRALASGQLVADVFPRPWVPADRLGPTGDWQVELRLQPGAPATQGTAQLAAAADPAATGAVCVVLAAGNQGFLGITDALFQLFVCNRTVLVKHHPVRAYNHRYCEQLFAPLIRAGYFASVVGGAELASRAIHHPEVGHVHMTGGKRTHDIIVWGEGSEEDRAKRKKARRPALDKAITSELGCVTPWIVAPEHYSDDELGHQATHLAMALMHNNSANCCAPKLLLIGEGWGQRAAFMTAFRSALRRLPHPPPYYPGSAQRFERLVELYRTHAGFEQIKSSLPTPPTFGPLGPPQPWTLVELSYDEARLPVDHAEASPLLTQEAFCPVLAVCAVPGPTTAEFFANATALCNDSAMGSLSCTVVAPDGGDRAALERALDELRYGQIAVNTWTAMGCRFEVGTWGAFPGESLDDVASGIGTVRNYLMFDHPQKTVVRSPIISPGHAGTTPPMSVKDARGLCDFLTGNVNTADNEGNPICAGNFLPLAGEGSHRDLEVEGRIPPELDGMYVRNGVNPRWEPTGRMHMFDGEAMLHCVRIRDGAAVAYANTWIKGNRYRYNEAAKREQYATFGDTAKGGLPVARKLGLLATQTRAGTIPALPNTRRSNPSTSTCYHAGKLYAVAEVLPAFRIFVDPETGVVQSDDFDDFDGRVEQFSAHYRHCPRSGELHYVGRPVALGAVQVGASGWSAQQAGCPAVYGVIDAEGRLIHQREIPMRRPGPVFIHDYFVTDNYLVVVDHSMRMSLSSLTTSGLYSFDPNMTVRFGLVPRPGRGELSNAPIRWFDAGVPGFHYHVLTGWEEGVNREGTTGQIVLWLPWFETYPANMPIHLPEEPPSYLRRVALDLERGTVSDNRVPPGLTDLPGERCDVNRRYFGQRQRWGYLMRRCEGREMYDGFVAYDLLEERVQAVVDYGPACFGGEALFVPKPNGDRENDGWLMDIVYDEGSQSSTLRIWDAAAVTTGRTEPIARVKMPHRVPYGVHGNWLTPEQLARQWAGRPNR